jgi:uncharacterized membrane protein HdeD (DUF308 family)
MVPSLARYWWMVAIRGAAAVVFGLFALIWPGVTLLALVVLFGAYALVDGALALVGAFGPDSAGRRLWMVVHGIASVVIGIITFAWPSVTTYVLLALIAAWAIVTGVVQIAMALRVRREVRGEWVMILGGLLSAVFGIVIAVSPISGALAIVFVIGAYAVVFGAALIGFSLRLRSIGSAQPAVAS